MYAYALSNGRERPATNILLLLVGAGYTCAQNTFFINFLRVEFSCIPNNISMGNDHFFVSN